MNAPKHSKKNVKKTQSVIFQLALWTSTKFDFNGNQADVKIFSRHLIVFVIVRSTAAAAVIGCVIEEIRTAAAWPDRLLSRVLPEIHPIGWPGNTAAHELPLCGVPGNQVIRTGALDGLLQRSMQQIVKVGFEEARSNATSQLNNKDNAQQNSKLCEMNAIG